jgi:hypothetical protein
MSSEHSPVLYDLGVANFESEVRVRSSGRDPTTKIDSDRRFVQNAFFFLAVEMRSHRSPILVPHVRSDRAVPALNLKFTAFGLELSCSGKIATPLWCNGSEALWRGNAPCG